MGIKFDFSKKDTSFTVRGKFFLQVEPMRLIHLIYDFEHLEKYMTIADSVELIRQGENWHEVSYAYKKSIFKTNAKFRRTLNENEQKITFEMTEGVRLGSFLPKVSSYSGHYDFRPDKDGCWVEYFQEVKAEPNILNWVIFDQGKKDVVGFLKNLENYVEKQIA